MKKGKTSRIAGFPEAKITYGTVDSKNLKSVYLNLQSWVNPKDEYENWDRIVSYFSKTIKNSVYEVLDKEIFKENYIVDLDLILEKEDAHYLTNVMRLREGDNVFLFNTKDGEFKGEIISSDKKNTKVKLISKIKNINKPGNISLIFSLIKSSKLAPRGQRPWWRDAVTYQIYIRSFADSNGDGIGDVGGIRSKLGYIKKLGVDAIWITPWYPSPQKDHGYDVADYLDIEPNYGTLKEGELLIKEAHDLGIKVIIDIVPNHTSDQHKWFKEALADKPGSAARDRYIFREGKGKNGELPPNNWQAVFGGPAWKRVTESDGKQGQWYLHLFAVEQPDLNWENNEGEL